MSDLWHVLIFFHTVSAHTKNILAEVFFPATMLTYVKTCNIMHYKFSLPWVWGVVTCYVSWKCNMLHCMHAVRIRFGQCKGGSRENIALSRDCGRFSQHKLTSPKRVRGTVLAVALDTQCSGAQDTPRGRKIGPVKSNHALMSICRIYR